MKFLISIFSLLILVSCSNQIEKQLEKVSFSIRNLPLPTDTTISSIAYLNGYFLILQDDGKFVVLDTTYRRVDSLERKLSNLIPDFLFRYNDTLFVMTGKNAYYLKNDFSYSTYNSKRRKYGEVLFEDSIYLAYGCCAGEFGGSVFFLDKKTGKTFSCFATCPAQVLRFGKEYIVCNNLAHLSDHMSFLAIKDPTTLYEITDEKLKNHCNWYTTVDSLKEYWQISNKGAVRFNDAYDAMSLVTFLFNDSLYSILSIPKATVLAVHRNDTMITMDTLINQKISFHETMVIDAGNKKICLYRLTEGSPFAAYLTQGNNTGLIIVDDKRIDFLY